MRRLLSLAALLLLPWPAVQADGAAAELRASAAESPGPVRLSASLDLVWASDLGGDDAPRGLSLSAQSLAVHQWSRPYAVEALGARTGTLPANESVDGYQPAEAAQAALRPGHKLGIRGLPGSPPPTAFLEAECGRLSPAEAPQRIQAGEEAPDGEWETPAGSLAWSGCRARLAVEGDFEVRLWEWDLRVEGGGRARTYRSGEEGPPLAANPLGSQDVRAARANTTILAAVGGTLRVDLPGRGILLGPATLRPDGPLLLSDVAGQLGDGNDARRVGGRSLSVEGDLVARVERAGDLLLVSVDGRLAGARLDGAELPAQAQASAGVAPSPLRWALAGATAALAAVLAAAALRVRLRRLDRLALASRLRGRASRAEDRGGHLRATLWAGAAIRLDPEHGDGYVVRAMARASRSRTRQALADHRRAHHRLAGRAQALNAFEAARAAALARQAGEAAQWLRIAMAHDARLLQEAALHPDFAAVAGHRALRSLVHGLGGGVAWAEP